MTELRSRASIRLRLAALTLLAILAVVGITMSRMGTTSPRPVDTADVASSGAETRNELALATGSTETGTLRTAVETKAASPAPSASPPPENGIDLVGDVFDREGRRIAQMVAELGLDDGIRRKSVPIVAAHYGVRSLSPGPFALECRVAGYRPAWRSIELRPGETEHREDFTVDDVWNLDVHLKTTDGGEIATPESVHELLPAAPFVLRVSRDPPPEHWERDAYEARTSLRRALVVSHFRTPGIYATLRPVLDPPCYLSGDIAGNVVAVAKIEERTLNVQLRVSTEDLNRLRSSFACRVIDGASNAPLAGARTLLHSTTGASEPVFVSDAAGQIRADDLLAGRYQVHFDAPAHSAPMRTVELLPGQTTDVGTIELEAPVALTGRCVDAAGKPVFGEFRLRPCLADGSVDPSFSSWSIGVPSELDGTFRRSSMPRALYVLSFSVSPATDGSAELRPRAAIVDLRHGPVEDLLVTFDRIQPVALMPRTEEAKEDLYRILTLEGAEYDRGEVGHPRGGAIELVPGSYRLLVGPDAASFREIPFTVGSGPVKIPIGP